MELEPLMTMHADLGTVSEVGTGPYGNRVIYDVSGGHFKGERLRGSILPSGGDWALIEDDGIVRLDVRITLKTEDDALIYVQYDGILERNEEANDEPTEYGETYFMTNPRYETGDERYKWLNRIVSVAEGRIPEGDAVEYRVFELVNG